jgi:hypothetical protein
VTTGSSCSRVRWVTESYLTIQSFEPTIYPLDFLLHATEQADTAQVIGTAGGMVVFIGMNTSIIQAFPLVSRPEPPRKPYRREGDPISTVHHFVVLGDLAHIPQTQT